MTLFTKNSFDLKTTVIVAADAAAAQKQLRALSKAEGWQRVATHGSGIAYQASTALDLPQMNTDGGYNVNGMEACDVGISECDALIA